MIFSQRTDALAERRGLDGYLRHHKLANFVGALLLVPVLASCAQEAPDTVMLEDVVQKPNSFVGRMLQTTGKVIGWCGLGVDNAPAYHGFSPKREDCLEVLAQVSTPVSEQDQVMIVAGGRFWSSDPTTWKTLVAVDRTQGSVGVADYLGVTVDLTGDMTISGNPNNFWLNATVLNGDGVSL